jgi:hypothetical protein
LRQDGLTGEGGPLEVHREDFVPLFLGSLDNPREVPLGGVGDQDVDASPFFDGNLGKVFAE